MTNQVIHRRQKRFCLVFTQTFVFPKLYLLIIAFAGLLMSKASGQEVSVIDPGDPVLMYGRNINIKDARSHIEEFVNVWDTTHYYNVSNDSTELR